MQRPPNAHLRDILQSGIQAPSAENKHHLRFEADGQAVRVVATDSASWTAQPHRRFLALTACGAVLENMRLRACQLGYEQVTQWWPAPRETSWVAHCEWRHIVSAPDPLADAIAQRHTNRRFYQRRPVPAATLARLSAAVAAVPGAELMWLDSPQQRRTALRAVRIAETERFRRRLLHHEMFSSIRFDIGWRQPTDEWLAPGTLEVEPPMRPGFRAMGSWPLMRSLCCIGAHHGLGLRAGTLPCALSPHLGLIVCTSQFEGSSALQTGRALQRAWLAATVEALAFQPMAASVVLTHQQAGGGHVSASAQRRIQQALATLTGSGRLPGMLFRLGYAEPPSLVAGRPPLTQFLAPELVAAV